MLTRREDFAPHRLALFGARLAIAGILLSGPLAAAVIHAVRPQPQWQGALAFVEVWHPVQLDRGPQERAVWWLLAVNGSVGIVGAAITVARLDWVLSLAGLFAYAAWNVLFLVTLVLAAAALHRRTRAGVP